MEVAHGPETGFISAQHSRAERIHAGSRRGRTFIGLDVHAVNTVGLALTPEAGEIARQSLAADPAAVVAASSKLLRAPGDRVKPTGGMPVFWPRCSRLAKQVTATAANCRYTLVTDALMCLRGIRLTTAFGLAVEIGNCTRFTGSSIGSYLGLVPSEESSGQSGTRAQSLRPETPTPGNS